MTETPAPSAAPPASDPELASALRKAFVRIIPLIGIGYCIGYTDRVNVSYAALQMNRDLHFTATIYSLGAGLFFLSYSGFEIPSNLLLVRFGARRWLARIMVTWGIVAAAMLFVRTPTEFYVGRLVLGVCEAGFFPGVLFYLTQWFPPPQRSRAISRFYIALPFSSVIMGSLAGALLNLQGRLGLAGWQWLFLLEGLPAVAMGIVFLFFLPESPATAKWLTEPECHALVSAVRAGAVPGGHDANALRRAMSEPRVWLFGLALCCVLTANYAVTFASPSILQAMNVFSIAQIGYILAGINLVGVPSMILGANYADRTGKRFGLTIAMGALIIAGFLLAGSFSAPLPVLLGMQLTIIGNCAMQGAILGLATSVLSGKAAAAGIAATNCLAILGGFIGPYITGFARDLTGSYQRGLLFMVVPMLLMLANMLYLRRRAANAAASGASDAFLEPNAPEPVNL